MTYRKTFKALMMATAMTTLAAGHALALDDPSTEATQGTPYNQNRPYDNERQVDMGAGDTGAMQSSPETGAQTDTQARVQTDAAQPGTLSPAGQLSDADVRDLQETLADRGFYNGPIDGIWGTETTAAVTSWQRAKGGPATGTLTTSDLQELGIDVESEPGNVGETGETDMRTNRE